MREEASGCFNAATVSECTWPGCVSVLDIMQLDPQFIDVPRGFIDADSPLVDRGVDPSSVVAVRVDREGDPRPVEGNGLTGLGWDIGADEAPHMPHVLISEVGLNFSGVSACDYVELYNPSDAPILLDGVSLQRGTANPGSITRVRLAGHSIAPYGFLLVGDDDWRLMGCDAIVDVDVLAEDDWVLNEDDVVMLVNGEEAVTDCLGVHVIDKVGFGDNACGEGLPALNPTSVSALHRKAHANSDEKSMGAEDLDSAFAPAYDSDHNDYDFLRVRGHQSPRNSLFEAQHPQ